MLKESEELWNETPPLGPETQRLALQHGIDPDAPLADWLTSEDSSRVNSVAREAALDPEVLRPMRPWLAAQVLTMASESRRALLGTVIAASLLWPGSAVATFLSAITEHERLVRVVPKEGGGPTQEFLAPSPVGEFFFDLFVDTPGGFARATQLSNVVVAPASLEFNGDLDVTGDSDSVLVDIVGLSRFRMQFVIDQAATYLFSAVLCCTGAHLVRLIEVDGPIVFSRSTSFEAPLVFTADGTIGPGEYLFLAQATAFMDSGLDNFAQVNFTLTLTAPEPSGIGLFALGLAALGLKQRRLRKGSPPKPIVSRRVDRVTSYPLPVPRQSYPKTTPRLDPKPDRLKIAADRERARRELLRQKPKPEVEPTGPRTPAPRPSR